MPARDRGMQLGPRRWCHREQLRYAPRLRSGLVLRENAPRREIERVLLADLLGRSGVANGCEPRATAWRGKALGKEPRRARMILVRARPENAALVLDTLVRDPGVI